METKNEFDKILTKGEVLNQSIGTSDETVIHKFSQEEIMEMQREFYDHNVELMKRDEMKRRLAAILDIDMDEEYRGDQLDQMIKEHVHLGGMGIKSLKKRSGKLMELIEAGQMEILQKCYLVPNEGLTKCGCYSENGELLKERFMTQEERQLSIKEMA